MSLHHRPSQRPKKKQSNRNVVIAGVAGGVLLIGVLAFVFLRGWGGDVGKPPPDVHVSIQKLSAIYTDYTAANKGSPPANVKQLKDWVGKQKKERLAQWGAEDLEATFTSPRDNQPYVILPVREDLAGPDTVMAHEQKGVGGKRFVLTAMGSAFEVDEAAFKMMVPGAR